MLMTYGGSLIFMYEQEAGAIPGEPVWVRVHAQFEGHRLTFRVRESHVVEQELRALFGRLMRIEAHVSLGLDAQARDRGSHAYPALGLTMGVRRLSPDGCELELKIADPAATGTPLHVLTGVAGRYIDDFIENLMEGAMEHNHPRIRRAPRQKYVSAPKQPGVPYMADHGF